jgi:putative transposase
VLFVATRRKQGIHIAHGRPAMSRPPRYAGFSYIGLHRYSLTFCTRNRVEAFRDARVAEQTLEQFRNTATIEGFAILVYCLMPEHGHLLVDATTDAANLRSFAKMAKQRSGGVFRRRHGQRLWQEGYYDRVLRPEEDVKVVARYILNNPSAPASSCRRWTIHFLDPTYGR